MKVIVNILVLLFGLWGCKEEYIPEPFDPSDWIGSSLKCDSTLKLLWQEPVFKDTSETAAFFYYREGKLFYQFVPGNEEKRPAEMGFFQLKDNKIVYSNKLKADPQSENYLFYKYPESFVLSNDILCYTDGRRLYGLNHNLELLWKIKPDGSRAEGYGSYFISNFKNLIFFPSNNQDIIDSTGYGMPGYLLGVDIHNGSKNILFTEPEQKYIRSNIDPPVAFEHNGDLITVFQIRKYNFFNGHNQSDLVSWNVTQNKKNWRLDSIDRMGIGSANAVLYENGKVYYAANSDIYCFDPISGSQIWKQSFTNFPYHFQTNNLLLTEKGLIVKSNDHEICLLNKENGQIQWENRNVGTSPNQLLYFKGDVFFNCGDGTLQCVNVSSGLVKFKMKSPNNCKDDRANYGINQFIINPENNLLYISDDFFVQCFQLKGYD